MYITILLKSDLQTTESLTTVLAPLTSDWLPHVQGNHTPFLCSLADLGSQLGLAPLRDAARDLLRLLPAEQSVISALRLRMAPEAGGDVTAQMERFFQTASPSVNLYQLEVCLALLLPATSQAAINEAAHSLQVDFLPTVTFFVKSVNSFAADFSRAQ